MIETETELSSLSQRLNALESVNGLAGQVEEVARQLQRIQGGSGLLEPQSTLSAWDQTTAPASAGLPPVVSYVGIAAQLLAGTGITFTRLENTPFLRIDGAGAGANVDYVVDATGGGTHTSLWTASTGALAVAIATGVSKTIWICTTHTETQSAAFVVTLAANQVITILSAGGGARPRMTIGHAGSVLTFSAASGSASRLFMKGFEFYRTTANAGHFSNLTGGIAMPQLFAEDMVYDGDTSNGTWGHWVDARTGQGSIGDVRWSNVTYVGLSAAASAHLSSIMATHTSSVSATFMDILDSDITVTNLWFHGSGSTDVDPANRMAFCGNRMTIVQTATADTGYGMKIGYVASANERGFRCNDNNIIFKSALDFIRLGNVNVAGDIEMVGNYFNASIAGGTSATTFANLRNDAGTVRNVTIIGNTLIGPGSGTGINVNGAAATASQFGLNAFYNWGSGTEVSGSGAMTTIFGPVTITGAMTFSGDVNVGDDLQVTGYARIGSLTAPTNTTDGDLTVIRLLVGNAALTAGVEAQITGDTTISGYLGIGTVSAPTNTTAGDFTCTRLVSGTDTPLGTGTIFNLSYTYTPTAATQIPVNLSIITTDDATAPGGSENDGLLLSMKVRPTANSTQRHIGLKFNVTHDSGAFNVTSGSAILGIQGSVSQAVAATTVSNAHAIRSNVAATAGTITTGRSLHVDSGLTGDSGIFTTLNMVDVTVSVYPSAITTLRGLNLPNLGNAAVTNVIALDIAAQSGAGTANIEFRNAGKMVYTPTSQTLAAATDIIVNIARVIHLDNSTGASLTLTSDPTISTTGAQSGQLITLVNVDSADDIVLRDDSVASSALRLPGAANLTLGPRDSATFIYISASTEWWCIAAANL